MSHILDTFLDNYNVNLSAVDTTIQRLQADIEEIERKEMGRGIKPREITSYATQKQEIYRQINALVKEKTEAAQYKTKFSPVQKLVSDIRKKSNLL